MKKLEKNMIDNEYMKVIKMINDEKIINLLEDLTISVSKIQSDITELKDKVNSIHKQITVFNKFNT